MKIWVQWSSDAETAYLGSASLATLHVISQEKSSRLAQRLAWAWNRISLKKKAILPRFWVAESESSSRFQSWRAKSCKILRIWWKTRTTLSCLQMASISKSRTWQEIQWLRRGRRNKKPARPMIINRRRVHQCLITKLCHWVRHFTKCSAAKALPTSSCSAASMPA